jgi:hypothetical protein
MRVVAKRAVGIKCVDAWRLEGCRVSVRWARPGVHGLWSVRG